jgi:N-formylmaleamate deformylase
MQRSIANRPAIIDTYVGNAKGGRDGAGMDDWHSLDVATNGTRLHVTRSGGDTSPLVLAHGATDSGLCWTAVTRALAPDHDVVMVDARGHGQSAAPPDGYDSGTQAADLWGVITTLGLRKPAILGHSMGAGTALALAGLYPDVPRAIILEDPGPWWSGWPSTPEERAEFLEIGERQRTYRRSTRDALIASRHAKTPAWSDAEVIPWAEAKTQVSDAAFQVFQAETWTGFDWVGTLRNIICRVLLVTADGGILTRSDVASFSSLVPHASHVEIAHAGHNIRRDQFAPYMTAVRAFLAN